MGSANILHIRLSTTGLRILLVTIGTTHLTTTKRPCGSETDKTGMIVATDSFSEPVIDTGRFGDMLVERIMGRER